MRWFLWWETFSFPLKTQKKLRNKPLLLLTQLFAIIVTDHLLFKINMITVINVDAFCVSNALESIAKLILNSFGWAFRDKICCPLLLTSVNCKVYVRKINRWLYYFGWKTLQLVTCLRIVWFISKGNSWCSLENISPR